MQPKKLSEKEIKELQKQFPVIEEKASWVGITVMMFWLLVLIGVLYIAYIKLGGV